MATLPLPSEWFREIGVAEFESSAVQLIEGYARVWAESKDEQSDTETGFRAFIELGAVEFSMAPLFGRNLVPGQPLDKPLRPWQLLPLTIDDNAAAQAILKTDCGPFSEHSRKSTADLKPWDLFTFAGDMSKLELLGISDINVLADSGRMEGLVDDLSGRYRQSGLGGHVVESGLLATEAFVWAVKLALLRGDDYTNAASLAFVSRIAPGSTSV